MEGGWLALLRATYGDSLVHNALADTPLAALGVQWGFGLYVVRAALDPRLRAQEHASLFRGFKDAMERHAVALGSRSVEVKGKKLHYKTLQMTDDVCTCKYVYEGNVRNPLIKMSGVPAVSDFLQSFYGKCNAESEHHFHQIVGNRYDKPTNQAIPWHSDKSALLSSNTDIVSVSLGCAGVFCYMPNEKAQFSDFHQSLKLGKSGISGGRRLLMVVYAVACRSSLVMFC
jgi:alkylated DNA repair dioxygenase AlkB